MYIHLITAPQIYEAKIDKIKKILDKFTITVKDSNTPLSAIERTRQNIG